MDFEILASTVFANYFWQTVYPAGDPDFVTELDITCGEATSAGAVLSDLSPGDYPLG